jgi:hypothetical protein
MLPILIYDFQNGFTQTVVFGGWFFYKVLQFLGFFGKSQIDNSSFVSAFNFFFIKYEQLTLSAGKTISMILFFASLILSVYYLKVKTLSSTFGVITSLTLMGLLAYFISGVPSEAYLVMLFPGLIFMFSLLIYNIKNKYVIIFVLFLIVFLNIRALIISNYLTRDSITLNQKIEAADKILKLSGGKDVELVYKGVGEEFESSVLPYEYLVWWFGGGEAEGQSVIIINENSEGIGIKELSK